MHYGHHIIMVEEHTNAHHIAIYYVYMCMETHTPSVAGERECECEYMWVGGYVKSGVVWNWSSKRLDRLQAGKTM